MRYSVEIPPKDPVWRLQIYAHLADSLSFHTIWLSDHYYNRNIAVAATAMSIVTKRIRIGLGIMSPYLYHPALMAQLAATLTEVAPGRVALGVGAGDETALESLGIARSRPVEKVREAVKSVRDIFQRGAEGEVVGLDFKPHGHIPLYIAAQGQRMLRLSAEIGDGVLINTSWLFNPQKPVSIVRDHLAAVGRGGGEFSAELEALLSIHEDAEKARKTVKPYVGVVIQGLSPSMIEELGIEDDVIRRIRLMVRARMWLEIHKVVPDEMVEMFAISGAPKDVRRRLEELAGVGLDGLVLGGPLGPTPRKALIMLDKILKGLSG
ncbi:MAG: LLM class flavin-dependent oxidoreductase [Nitrososphaerota archaeon]